MKNVHDSLLDPLNINDVFPLIERDYLLSQVGQFEVDPIPFHDCMGRVLKENDLVLYSDKDWGPRPGIVVKIEDNGEFCAVSYSGHSYDCENISGEIICNDLVYKCLKIDMDILKKILSDETFK